MDNTKLNIILKAIDEKKGEDITTYDVTGRNPFYDSVVIASLISPRQAGAIVEEIEKNLALIKENIHHVEGKIGEAEWILIDANGIIVHLFTKNERARVDLDKILSKEPKM
jgi:ribosome-associated protein